MWLFHPPVCTEYAVESDFCAAPLLNQTDRPGKMGSSSRPAPTHVLPLRHSRYIANFTTSGINTGGIWGCLGHRFSYRNQDSWGIPQNRGIFTSSPCEQSPGMPAYFYHLSLEVLRSSHPPEPAAATSSPALDSAWEALLPFQKRVRPSTSIPTTSSGGDSLSQFTQPHTHTGKEITLEQRFKNAHASSSSDSSGYSAQHSPSTLPANYPSTSPNRSSDLQNDARAGAIRIECIDMVHPDDVSRKRAQKRGRTVVPTGSEDNIVATGIGTDILGGLRTKGRYIPIDQEVGDSVWGIVHLYRDVHESPYLAGNDDDYPTYLKGSAAAARHPIEQQSGGASRAQSHSGGKGSADLEAYPFPVTASSSGKEDECTTLCILAVPIYLSPPDFLGYVGQKTMDEVSHFRMIRTPRPNRYMVLMKFRSGAKAKAWQKEWNGQVFNNVEVCLDYQGSIGPFIGSQLRGSVDANYIILPSPRLSMWYS